MSEITVIVPVEDNDENLDKTLYSLNHQNLQNFEIFIVSNKEPIFSAKLDQKPRTLLLKNKSGISELLNNSLSHISTKYSCILPCGDLLLFDGIKTRYEAIINYQANACYGLGFDTNEKNEIIQNNIYEIFYEQKVLPDNGFPNLLKLELFPPISSLMIETDIIKRLKFDESYKIAYAWDFFIRLFNDNKNIKLINDPIYISSSNFSKKSMGNFTSFLKETSGILDDFSYIEPKLMNESYKNLFWLYYFMVNTHFKDNKKPLFYLMLFYLKKAAKSKCSEFDFVYFMTLLNNIAGYRK
jgi:glycosyltransferase involved in cell wall biosynthesis